MDSIEDEIARNENRNHSKENFEVPVFHPLHSLHLGRSQHLERTTTLACLCKECPLEGLEIAFGLTPI